MQHNNMTLCGTVKSLKVLSIKKNSTVVSSFLSNFKELLSIKYFQKDIMDMQYK